MPKQTFGLGRGLSSLIPSRRKETEPSTPDEKSDYFSAHTFSARPIDELPTAGGVSEIPIESIVSNQYQPRQYFADKNMQELSSSIKEHGILQPIVIIKKEEGGYELIAGERRLRAAKMAGLKKVPAIIREANDLDKLQLALIENIQRSDLNPIEEAQAYQKLNDEFGLTQDDIAKKMGRGRPSITNTIRLLSLPSEMKQAIAEGKITEGHAKVLLEIKDEAKRLALFKQILQQKLTISDTRGEVKRIQVREHTRHTQTDPNIAAAEEQLRRALGTKVSVRRRGKNGGEIVIEYYGDEELQALIGKLGLMVKTGA